VTDTLGRWRSDAHLFREPVTMVKGEVLNERTRRDRGEWTELATEISIELDEQLVECKTALQHQAEEMLSILAQFEERLKARLDAAEARLAAFRAETALHPPSTS
jgi:hypothetical protein